MNGAADKDQWLASPASSGRSHLSLAHQYLQGSYSVQHCISTLKESSFTLLRHGLKVTQ